MNTAVLRFASNETRRLHALNAEVPISLLNERTKEKSVVKSQNRWCTERLDIAKTVEIHGLLLKMYLRNGKLGFGYWDGYVSSRFL